MSRGLFEEYVFPYDKVVYDVLHRHGGKLRIHCHGACMQFLERFAEMGVDAIEPLEAPPFGDVDLAEAKRRVGGRMLLSGNVNSTLFTTMTAAEVRAEVRQAIRAGARGGGFTLRTTGGSAGTGSVQTQAQLAKVLENCEVYFRAGLEYGGYPVS
jgi:uroporphyrinogen-III decarboxylase